MTVCYELKLYDIMTSTTKEVYCPKLVKYAQADVDNLCIMWAINVNYAFCFSG